MGIWNDRINSSQASGAANTPTTINIGNVSGGSVAAGQAIRITGTADSAHGPTDTGKVTVKLGGNALWDSGIFLDGQSGSVDFDLYVWRDGSNGVVTGTIALAAGVFRVAPTGVTGLSWGSGQSVDVVAESSGIGGIVLQRCGVQK